jgi:hypothetical protein
MDWRLGASEAYVWRKRTYTSAMHASWTRGNFPSPEAQPSQRAGITRERTSLEARNNDPSILDLMSTSGAPTQSIRNNIISSLMISLKILAYIDRNRLLIFPLREQACPFCLPSLRDKMIGSRAGTKAKPGGLLSRFTRRYEEQELAIRIQTLSFLLYKVPFAFPSFFYAPQLHL